MAAAEATPAAAEEPTTAKPPAEPESKPSLLPVDLDALVENVRCSICMGILRNTHAVSVCMHRFCKDCIERWLRTQRENNCPQCRVQFASRRDCRADPQFDHLLRLLFGDLDAFEERTAPSAATMERAKSIGLQIMKAQEERKARPPPPPPPKPPAAAAAEPDAVAHVTLLAGKQPLPSQAAAGEAGAAQAAAGEAGAAQAGGGSGKASPSTGSASVGLKRSRSAAGHAAAGAAGEDSKRSRAATPELASPTGSNRYKGVRFTNGRYQARLKLGGRETSLGQFDSAEAAARAFDLEQLRRFGSRAQLNLPHLREQYLEELGPAVVAAAGAKPAPSGTPAPRPSRQRSISAEAAAAAGVGAPAYVDPAERARARAAALAAQRPLRTAFASVPPVAQLRLEPAGGSCGALPWSVRYLACPAATTVGELKRTVTVGLSLQHGTAAFAAPLELAVANDLEAAADFDALFTVDEAGGLLLRDHVTIRELLGLLEDCTEQLALEYSC